MPKRFTDTEIWKSQRWFRKLSPTNKLIFFYIKDQCNHAGIWKIDCSDLIDDLGLDKFILDDFINEMNLDFDKITGSKSHKERVKLIKNNNLWITGFIQFQYESKDKLVSESSCVKTALMILKGLEIYDEALNKGYITLKNSSITINENDVTLNKGMVRLKDKDKDKDNISSINTLNTNSISIKKEYNTVTDSKDSNWETDKNIFTSDEQMQMNYKTVYSLSREEVVEYINKFITQIELAQDYKDLKELRKHFKNWMNKKNPIGKFQKEVPQYNPKGYVVQTPMHLWDKNCEGEE